MRYLLLDCPDPLKYPGRGDGIRCARWEGAHQHLAISNFNLNIEGPPIDFEMGHFETQF